MRKLLLPDTEFTFSFLEPYRMSLPAYERLCRANPDLRIERDAEGELRIMAPAGAESDHRNAALIALLYAWAKLDGRGRAFGASTEFILPDGSAYSPDAAWVSDAQLTRVPKARRRRFLRLAPEFIAEVMSPTDRLKTAQAKMQDWMRNGVQLGWLFDCDHQSVYVYRAGAAKPRKLSKGKKLAGEGPLAGFTLDLTDLWAEL